MTFWTKRSVEMMYDEVLVRSAMEFGHALDIMERNGVAAENPYLQEIRQGLALMKKELRRRGIGLPSQGAPAPPLRPQMQQWAGQKSRA